MTSANSSYPDQRYAWIVVIILSVAGIVSYVDRTVINLLVGPIRADLGISDTQFSLLQGFAFSLFYALLAIPLARLSDAGNRKWVIIGGVVCWSLATFASGLVATFTALFAARMLIGVGEATLTPGGYSLISDYFPKEKLSAAISVFTASSFLGSGVALIAGGALISYLMEIGPQTLPVLGTLKPWQMTFILISLPSVLVLVLMMFVREPARQASLEDVAQNGSDMAKSASVGEVMAFVSSKARVIFAIYFGLTLLAAALYAVNGWVPEFLIRTYAWTPKDVGLYFGPMVIVCCFGGMTAGGWVCNVMIARGISDANLRLPILSALCLTPFAIAFGLMPTATLSLICLAPTLFFGALPFGVGTAALPLIAPNRMRAQMVAGYLFIANLLSYGLGPIAVTSFSDYVLGGENTLGLAFAIILPVLILASVAILASGLSPYRAMVARSGDHSDTVMDGAAEPSAA
ncbi:MAG: MFS transporter [Pseudomonadota bacterium]